VSGAGEGLTLDGEPIRNIFAYDSAGEPLLGVQLYDEEGDPLEIKPWSSWRRGVVAYPWPSDGTGTELRNVFPLPTREQNHARSLRGAFESDNPPAVPVPPFLQVPSLPELPAASLRTFLAAVRPPVEADPRQAPGSEQEPEPEPRSERGDQRGPKSERQSGSRDDGDAPRRRTGPDDAPTSPGDAPTSPGDARDPTRR